MPKIVHEAIKFPPVGKCIPSCEEQYFCPICEQRTVFAPFGRRPRPYAKCCVCGSLERHRFAWLFLCRKSDLFLPRKQKMLHIAPERCLSARFRAIPNIVYLSTDLNDKFASVKMDITSIGFADNSFDAIFCSHTLEHVNNDRQAIAELRRVLSPSGWVLLMVPISSSSETFEDPSITDPRLREKYFGQSDHVRHYGHDFIERLRNVGLEVDCFSPESVAERSEIGDMSLLNSDKIFFCRKAALDQI